MRYGKLIAAIRATKSDTAPLVRAQLACIAMRDRTCDYEQSLYDGGTIVPMIDAKCLVSTTRPSRKKSASAS